MLTLWLIGTIGYVLIDKKITHYILKKTDKDITNSSPKDSQKILLDSLFSKKEVIDVGSYNPSIVNTSNDLLFWIADNYKKDYFTSNLINTS